MLTVKCDKCGKEKSVQGIVTQQFKYDKGYRELTKAHRHNGLVDLCKSCFDEYTSLVNQCEKEKSESVLSKARRLFFQNGKVY